MEEAQEPSSQEKENLAGDVMESLGEPKESANEIDESHESKSGHDGTNDPLYVQKRLKRQQRAHEREIRELQSRIDQMQSGAQPNQSMHDQMEPYEVPEGNNIAEHVSKAVSYALQAKDREERKAKEAERQAHVQRSYQGLNKHLDDVADKYEDFDDVVRGEDAPFTPHMRDAALLLPHKGSGSAGEVLYKLGKNRSELERISKLHPLDQARELTALSHALANGSESKSSASTRPMGDIKSNPVRNTGAVTEKTSPAEIRARMKAGKFR